MRFKQILVALVFFFMTASLQAHSMAYVKSVDTVLVEKSAETSDMAEEIDDDRMLYAHEHPCHSSFKHADDILYTKSLRPIQLVIPIHKPPIFC
jgi:hypothetical protein